MKKQNRTILLFVDNPSSHPLVNLSNVKVQFLPPNTTSLTQPMDQGIIQTVTLKFRKRQVTLSLGILIYFRIKTNVHFNGLIKISNYHLQLDMYFCFRSRTTVQGYPKNIYTSEESKTELLDAIKATLDENLTENLQQSDYIGLILDESTDITVHKKWNVYVKCLVSNEPKVVSMFKMEQQTP